MHLGLTPLPLDEGADEIARQLAHLLRTACNPKMGVSTTILPVAEAIQIGDVCALKLANRLVGMANLPFVHTYSAIVITVLELRLGDHNHELELAWWKLTLNTPEDLLELLRGVAEFLGLRAEADSHRGDALMILMKATKSPLARRLADMYSATLGD